MRESTEAEVLEIGREAAEAVAGEDAVEGVEVRHRLDSLDRPAFEYYVLIDLDRVPLRPGLILARLTQELRYALAARGHEELPIVWIMSRADWEKRSGA